MLARRSPAYPIPNLALPGAVLSLTAMTDGEVLAVWAEAMDELRRREVVRSANNPTGDYAEGLVAAKLGLTLMGNSASGYDALGEDGSRYQIKAPRLVTAKTSRQLSPLRNLDEHPFDQLIVVFLGRSFELLELWQLPISLVRDHAKYRAHVNGHILIARGAVLEDARAVKLA